MSHRFEVEVIRLLRTAVRLLHQIKNELSPSAVSGLIEIEREPMATLASFSYTDASGDPASAPAGDGSGLTVTFGTSDTSIATIGATDPSTLSAPITELAPGDYQVSADVANVSGAELFDDDGTTAFVQPTPVTVTSAVTPPSTQAVTGVISVT